MKGPSPRASAACSWIVLGLAGAAAVGLLAAARGILAPFALAAGLAYLFYPLVCYVETRSVPRPVAILILYAGTAIALWGMAKVALPPLVQELSELMDTIPRQTERLEGFTRRTVEDAQSIRLPAAREALDAFLERVQGLLTGFAARLADLLVGLAGGMFSLALAPVLAYFLLRDWDAIRDGLLAGLSPAARRHALELGARINRVLHGFIRGQLLVSAAVGALAAAGLWVLGVRYALVVGIFAGLLDIVPYFGPVLGALPAVALALAQSPQKALYVLLFFAAVQHVESSILSPKIVGRSVGLHPLSVIAAVLLGAQWLGVFGMVVAVPALSALKVVLAYGREVREGPGRGPEGGSGRGPEWSPARGPKREPGTGPDWSPEKGAENGPGERAESD